MTGLLIALGAVLLGATLLTAALGLRKRYDFVPAVLVIFFVALATIGKLLGLVGGLQPDALVLSAIGFCLASALVVLFVPRANTGVLDTIELFRPPYPNALRAPLAWLALLGTLLTLGYRGFVAVQLPPKDYDSIFYHLVSVSQWVRTGSLSRPFLNLGSTNPQDVIWADAYPKDAELISTWSAVFRGDLQFTQLTQQAFAVLLGFAVYGLCRRLRCTAPWSVLAACAVITIPAAQLQLDTNYVDVAMCAAVVAGTHFGAAAMGIGAKRIDLCRGTYVYAMLAGTSFGLAAGIKATSVAFGGVAMLTIVIVGMLHIRWHNLHQAPGEGPALPECATRRASKLALWFVVPLLVFGTFWYLRTWFFWGSPLWPMAFGPIPGPFDPTYFYQVVNLPAQWQGEPGPLAAAQMWGSAVTAPFSLWNLSYQQGGLGFVWLFLALPALGWILFRPFQNRDTFVSVIPLVLASLASGSYVVPRFSLPLAVAGTVALAVVATELRTRRLKVVGSARHRLRPKWTVPPRVRTGSAMALAAATLVGLVGNAAWATSGGNWDVNPGKQSASDVIDAAVAPAEQRRAISYWTQSDRLQSKLANHEPVAFLENAPLWQTLTTTGLDMKRPLYVLPAVSNLKQLAAEMRQRGLRYVYLSLNSPELVAEVKTSDNKVLRPVSDIDRGFVYELVTGNGGTDAQRGDMP